MTVDKNSKFNFIRYANVWEDADILCESLAPVAKQGRILSVASSGDNVLALLTLDPKEIVAVDLSPQQLACLEIRIAAFKALDYQKLCEFLGLIPIQNRVDIYQNQLKCNLTANAVKFWDEKLETIRNGIIHAGKFERYLRIFGKWILPIIHSKSTIEELLKEKSQQNRLTFYNEKWDRWGWRLLFKFFFSRFIMGHAGRDPSFFNHVEGSVSKQILARTKHALTECQTHQNPFLHYILKGNFSNKVLPYYLKQENFYIIKSRLDRLKLVHGSVTQVKGCFDAFNLSNIFEYMDKNSFNNCYKNLLEIANTNARLVYWNMLVPRSCPETFLDKVISLTELSASLHKKDKAWFYQKFVVEQLLP